MKKNRFLTFTIVATLLIFTNSCEKDAIETKGIRTLPYLTTKDIPSFSGMTQTELGRFPLSVPKDIPENYSVDIEFRWESNDGDYAYIDIRVTESNENAITALMERHKYSTNPFIEENRDEPAVVGDLSYFKGIEFIRDNLIVRIHTSEKFDNSTTEIARYVDDKILRTRTFNLIDEVKPIIKEFAITEDSILERTQIPIILEVEDPNNCKIISLWIIDNILGLGGNLIKDDVHEEYFYSANSVYDNMETNENELAVVVINEYGFWAKSDSVIHITTLKEPRAHDPCPCH